MIISFPSFLRSLTILKSISADFSFLSAISLRINSISPLSRPFIPFISSFTYFLKKSLGLNSAHMKLSLLNSSIRHIDTILASLSLKKTCSFLGSPDTAATYGTWYFLNSSLNISFAPASSGMDMHFTLPPFCICAVIAFIPSNIDL